MHSVGPPGTGKQRTHSSTCGLVQETQKGRRCSEAKRKTLLHHKLAVEKERRQWEHVAEHFSPEKKKDERMNLKQINEEYEAASVVMVTILFSFAASASVYRSRKQLFLSRMQLRRGEPACVHSVSVNRI